MSLEFDPTWKNCRQKLQTIQNVSFISCAFCGTKINATDDGPVIRCEHKEKVNRVLSERSRPDWKLIQL
jgi:hypothetical protein